MEFEEPLEEHLTTVAPSSETAPLALPAANTIAGPATVSPPGDVQKTIEPLRIAATTSAPATAADIQSGEPSLLIEAEQQSPTDTHSVAAPPRPATPELVKTALPVAVIPVDTATPDAVEITEVPAAEAPAPQSAPTSEWLQHTVAKGESLARIFNSYGLDRRVLHGIVNSSKDAGTLANIRPGQTLRLLMNDDKSLDGIELQRSRVETLRVKIDDDQYTFERLHKDVETRIGSASGVIESSLFVDGQRAGLSDGLIMELANIFGWDIDFALEIRAGDEFRVVFEEHYLDGEKLRDGPILAAEFTNHGETFRAIRYGTPDGEIGYYDDEGRSKRRAFIRTPIKFARISSRFNPKRWHPVLKKWRSHKGVDYAAPSGTPIRASGDGKVIFQGTKGGYGRTVILQHAGKYTTLYAHMSKYAKKARTGARVKQGQIIGYVGSSGLASGPHLHYEFRVNGVHKDPLRVKLPKSLALPKSEVDRFKQTAKPLLAQLDSIRAETLLASNEAGAETENLPR
ncbi:MAG: peptidoglycan DD-metalloendopeptidase family protein [Gammaproteobacteria bacterium]|nr:peptidoglycan DD-metalloendopeptidase family protein [Gammaproteobacteria bacterium]